MAEGNETPGNEPPEGGDLDFLAARRARRAAEISDPALARRAEAAEATVRTLETHMASLQSRLRELEDEQRRTAEQLGEREHEMRRVKQREYAEQQLRVEAEESRERLGREHRAEVDRLNRRLSAGERHARELADQLERARRELAEAEQTAAAERAQLRRTQEELTVREADLSQRELALERTSTEVERRLLEARAFEHQAQGLSRRTQEDAQQLTAQLVEFERRTGELQHGLEVERAARERSEQILARAQHSYARLERIVSELGGTAVHLRAAVEREQLQRSSTPLPEPVPAPASAPVSPPPVPEEDALRRAEMAEALAAAVERLRARVAAVAVAESEPVTVSEPEPAAVSAPESVVVSTVEPAAAAAREPTSASESESAPTAANTTIFRPRLIPSAIAGEAWLAPAIRHVAERRDAKLAGELIVELLAAQCLVLDKRLTYRLRIAELGFFEVHLGEGRASVARVEPQQAGSRGSRGPRGSSGRADFVLEGPAAAFSELAGGGAGRRFAGLRVNGSRRRARRLLAARHAPVGLVDLVSAELRVWPGLLLLALAEAIDPVWTAGSRFVVGFAIEGVPGAPAVLYVQARDGEPLLVTRVRGDQPQTVVHLSEGSFMRIFAGLPLPDTEQVLIEGEAGPLEQLIHWADRAQGRRCDA